MLKKVPINEPTLSPRKSDLKDRARLQSTVTILQLPTTDKRATAGNRVKLGSQGLSGKSALEPSKVQSSHTSCYFSGPENQLIVQVIRKLLSAIEQPAESKDSETRTVLPQNLLNWSPLTFTGPSGCGKTYLAQAVADHWQTHREEDAFLFITAVDFRRRYDQAIREQTVEEFRERFRSLSLLVIDDLHRLPKNASLQEEILSLLNAIRDSGGLVITTLSKPVNLLDRFSRRLLSRFAEGLTLEVAPLSSEARTELLCHTLETNGGQLEPDAAATLSYILSSDARRVLKIAGDLSRRFGNKKAINSTQAAVFIAEQPKPDTPPLKKIATQVAKYYSLPLKELRSSSRKQAVVLSRAVAIYLARDLTPMSYEDIGRFFGGRDHTTIMHNHHRIEKCLPTDRALRNVIEELRGKFGGSF